MKESRKIEVLGKPVGHRGKKTIIKTFSPVKTLIEIDALLCVQQRAEGGMTRYFVNEEILKNA